MVSAAFHPMAAQFDSRAGSRSLNPSQDPYDISGWISGEILNTDGLPAQNATVELHGTGGKSDSTRTDSDGKFEFHNLAAGEWELVARTGNRLTEARQYIRVTPGVNIVTLTFPAEKGSVDPGPSTTSAAQLAVPGKARREFEKAEEALRKSKLNDAIRFVEKALTLWPRFAEALTLRAIVERSQQSSELAVTDAQKAIEYDPNYGKAYAVLGSIYTDAHRVDDAIRTLDHGIAIAPTYWATYYEMSRALLLRGDFATTLRQAEKASSLVHGEYPPLHLVKGYAHLGLKNASAARTELETYIKLGTDPALTGKAKEALAQLSGSSR